MTQFYYHDGQQEQGPFDIEQLKSKDLKKDTPIWYEGLDSWTTVSEVEELTKLFAVKPTPPPLKKQSEQSYASSVPVTEQTEIKKRSSIIPIIIGGLIIIGAIAGWLIYQNSKNNDTIDSLQEKVSSQDQTISTQQQVLTNQQNADAEKQRINEANTEKNMNFRNNWEKYITIQNSEPTIDYTLGGISEFAIEVTNQTTYMLDQVDIYVQYIRKNGELYQTKTVTILNVPPGSMANGIAPASVNGIKINCSIEKIVSKNMHFCYPENNGNPSDPYFCK